MQLLWWWSAPIVMLMFFGFSQDPGRPQPRQVEIWLGAPVGKIKGFDWPRGKDGTLQTIVAEARPYWITVHLPSGQKYTVWSCSLFLSQHKGLATEVTIDPLEHFVSFHQAVAAAETEAKKIRFQEPWDLFGRLKEWAELKRPPEVSMAGTGIVEEQVTLFIEARRRENKGNPIWFANLSFSFWEDKKVWEIYKGPKLE